eukprot:scpid66818/ scgid10369/ 
MNKNHVLHDSHVGGTNPIDRRLSSRSEVAVESLETHFVDPVFMVFGQSLLCRFDAGLFNEIGRRISFLPLFKVKQKPAENFQETSLFQNESAAVSDRCLGVQLCGSSPGDQDL